MPVGERARGSGDQEAGGGSVAQCRPADRGGGPGEPTRNRDEGSTRASPGRRTARQRAGESSGGWTEELMGRRAVASTRARRRVGATVDATSRAPHATCLG